jgi:hypothetical protein
MRRKIESFFLCFSENSFHVQVNTPPIIQKLLESFSNRPLGGHLSHSPPHKPTLLFASADALSSAPAHPPVFWKSLPLCKNNLKNQIKKKSTPHLLKPK